MTMVPSEAELLEESQLELIEDIGEATPDYDDDDDGENVNLGTKDIRIGTEFPSFDESVRSMNKWCDENFVALVRRSSNKGTYDDDGDKPGRIHFICTHGYKRKSRATHHRPIQRVNFTECPCHVTITQKDRGQWVVTSVEMSHEGHLVSEDVYHSYQHVKKLSKELCPCKNTSRNVFITTTQFKNALGSPSSGYFGRANCSLLLISSMLFHFNLWKDLILGNALYFLLAFFLFLSF